MKRLRIVISSDWFPPAYRAGGPIRSAFNLCALLSEHHDIWVVTGSHDLGAEKALEVAKDRWNAIQINDASIQVRYCSQGTLDRRLWSQLLDEISPDVLHLNSMFSKDYTLIPLRIARSRKFLRVVLAPRGMLGEAALSIKPLKKRIFLSIARMMGLFRGVIWHASTSKEVSEVRTHFISADVRTAQNLPAAFPSENPNRPVGHWKIVVIGRIHRVKNLDFGLKALLKASSNRSVLLDFIGPLEDENYQKELADVVRAQEDVKVRFLGGIPPTELPEHLQAAHFLLSSTTQENFGHSIVEAWAHGCPVLISDRTPWLQLQEKGIGWDLPLDPDSWQVGLSKALTMNSAQWEIMSEESRVFFKTHVRNDEAEKANLELFCP
jgi:glycosyltransferase involved in cell wall biosynthesis